MSQQHSGAQELHIFQYDKRRYDGGSEIELIRQVEDNQQPRRVVVAFALPAGEAAQVGKNGVVHAQCPDIAMPFGLLPVQAKPLKTAKIKAHGTSRLSKKLRAFGEALLIGPMEIVVGLLGIATTTLALSLFVKVYNQPMALQCKQVMKDCTKTLLQGIGHTVTAPGRAVLAAVKA